MSEIICDKCNHEFPISQVKVKIINNLWTTGCPVCGFSYTVSTMPKYCCIKKKTVLPVPDDKNKK